MGFCDKRFDLFGGDAGGEDAGRGFLYFECDLLGALHQRDLRLGFNHPARPGNVAAIDEIEPVSRLPQSVERKERGRFINGQGPAGAVRLDRIDNKGRRVFVFFPPAYFARHNDGGCRFLDLECGADIAERTIRGDHRTVQALLTPGAQAGVTIQARRRIQIQCRDPLLAHQLLRFCNARFSFGIADRMRIAAHRLHGLQFSRRVGSANANRHEKWSSEIGRPDRRSATIRHEMPRTFRRMWRKSIDRA